MKKRFTRILAAVALLVGLTIPMGMWGQTTVASFSRSGTTDTYTEGQTFSKVAEAKTGYYQDGSGTAGETVKYLQLKGDNEYWTSTPQSISFTATLGGGSIKNPLENNVLVVLLDADGNEISGTSTIVTDKITNTTGSNFTVSIPVVDNAYGVKISHIKESGYNVRYYGFSLSYVEEGGQQPTCTVTYKANGPEVDDVVETYNEGATVNLKPANTFTYDGYTFSEWNTQADGDGDAYEAEGTIENIQDDIELYAIWTENSTSGTNVTFVAGTDTGSTSVTKDGITVSMSTMSRTDNYRCYANTDMTIVSNVGNISKVVLTCVSGNGANNFSIPTNGVGTYTYSTDNLVGTWTGSSTTVTLHASAQVRITEIVVTYEPNNTPAIIANPSTLSTFSYLSTSTDPSAAQQVTVSGANLTAGITVSVGANSAFEMCTTENGDYSNSDITLPQTNGAVAATSIYVRMKANQTGTPSGTLALSSTGATSVTIDLNGSVVTPMTVAEAIAAIAEASGNTVDDAYVSGIVCQIDEYDSSHNSITYWISDDGTTTTKLEVYSGKGLNGANFTSVDDLTVGDEVVVFGDLKMYGEVYEFNYNNYLVSWVHNVIPVISADNVDLLYTATSGEINYSIQNGEGNVSAELTEGDWLVLGEVTANTVPFTCSANTGEERTATITLSFEGANDKIVTVTQAAYEAPFEPATYKLATSIESGKTYIIVGLDGDDPYAMGEQRDSNRGGYAISVNGSIATVSSANVHEVVITALEGDDAGYYTIEDGGYLYAASSSANQLKTKNTLDDNGKWSIDITNGEATITAQGSNTRNEMRFNPNTSNNNPLFACYASTSTTGSLPRLFVKVPTLNINGYASDETKDGYYLIASPVTVDPATVTGMTSDDFDLYYFDESQELEWRNYEDTPFDLVPGKGYLYAKKGEGQTYTFTLTGTPYNNQPITLSKSESGDFAGWNLVGNPFGDAAYITKSYYRMNSNHNEVVEGSGAINPMEGVFVIATANNEQLTFSTTAPAAPEEDLVVNLNNSRGTVIDRAVVRFGQGDQLPKFQINPNNTKIYVTEGNKDYAVVRSAAEAEMPVSFRASENGTYTLAVEAENVEMNYLHLIDNLTGMDVDLLQTPSYTFDAKTSDYASRFRLVFKANGTNENNAETFAYFNGTNWTVSNVGEATLQVVDVTGRTVANQMINGNAELNLNQPAGVYVIRLVNGDNVKTQKVVVR